MTDPRLDDLRFINQLPVYPGSEMVVRTYKFPDAVLECGCRLVVHVPVSLSALRSEDMRQEIGRLAREYGQTLLEEVHVCDPTAVDSGQPE